MTDSVAPAEIRARFAAAMSAMYRAEVPLYAELLEIVAQGNAQVLAQDPALAARLAETGEIARLDGERHGAIRLGTGAELRALARIFALMGMHPVGYYDLAPAGVPVHSTAFRPIEDAELAANPFRVFTSLLRLELIEDVELRARAAEILAGRSIVSPRCLALVARAETAGFVARADLEEFLAEALAIFRWHADALVDLATYEELLAAHRLIADVVAFRGPHINHLTPRSLDIDAAQAAMRARGLPAKSEIEGPPARAVPILLRQTSFLALNEAFRPAGAREAAAHTARFGEIEQRGVALTPSGHALYDRCLAAAREGDAARPYAQRLAEAFAPFPDDLAEMHRQGLAYARFLAPATPGGAPRLAPVTYEDFLPVSAAGIFRSNLAQAPREAYAAGGTQPAFEAALGGAVLDPFALYAATEEASKAALCDGGVG